MRFFKLLSDDDIKRCLKSVKAHNFKDGKQTQPSNEMKSNEESINIPDDVRKLITDRFYDTHYVDSVYCPTEYQLISIINTRRMITIIFT